MYLTFNLCEIDVRLLLTIESKNLSIKCESLVVAHNTPSISLQLYKNMIQLGGGVDHVVLGSCVESLPSNVVERYVLLIVTVSDVRVSLEGGIVKFNCE
jgi:hypothetical protein